LKGTTRRRVADTPLPGLIAKVALLGLLNAVAIWAIFVLVGEGVYWLAIMLAAGCALIDWVFLTPRLFAWRYLIPGLIFMAAMVVYPICYTVAVAFTNYGTGHVLTKEQVIENYVARFTLQEEMPEYQTTIYRSEDGKFAVFLVGPGGENLIGMDGEVTALDDTALSIEGDRDGVPERIGPYQQLGILELFQHMSSLEALEFHFEDSVIRMRSVDRFATYAPQYHYDEELDALVDCSTGKAFIAKQGAFLAEDGEALDVGYRAPVGWSNFSRLLRSLQVSGPFLRVFVWTFEWAALSVLTTFGLGLLLAVILNDNKMKFKGFYRVLLLIPYAMPVFISALIWRGLLNTEVGLVNDVLQSLFGVWVPWLQDPFWAKVALVIVNLWLGFPYMMLINLGSLQSIPDELYEAARVDGASGWQQFWHVTLPLLLVSVAPLLVSCFAFNFNNFGVIYLVTQGRPPIPGARTPAGATDILITYTYRLAFESGSGTDYGLASAVTILIFLIVGTLSWFNFRFTGTLEEVRENV